MEHAVALRVQGEAAWARAVVDALQRDLRLRARAGSAIRVEPTEGPTHAMRIAMPGAELPPLALPDEPDAAATEALDFLSRWGFVGMKQQE
ncbi:MAG: hypothetical protein QOE90_3297 [Thermoplasmata archaeon]|jgi:predicted DNA-binding transcriptional regulator YafY|nr:hypothetical protein [Thermoplasmata archaeon]